MPRATQHSFEVSDTAMQAPNSCFLGTSQERDFFGSRDILLECEDNKNECQRRPYPQRTSRSSKGECLQSPPI